MADPKDQSFFRKVVRFVANPATDWAELNSRQPEDGAIELERSELKAMIERKRRNDFVRKREFDMLRKVRREGLSPEQLAALGGSSRIDDSEARLPDNPAARQEAGVKAKIDEIEQQMVGDGLVQGAPGMRRLPGLMDMPTRAGDLTTTRPAIMSPPIDPARRIPLLDDVEHLPALPPLPPIGGDFDLPPLGGEFGRQPAGNDADPPRQAAAAPGMPAMPPGLPPLSPVARPMVPVLDQVAGFSQPFAVEVSEVAHDPELDEAVIAFANADFTQCEQALAALTAAGGGRAQHAETWLVLFDLYRATGQQHKFESLALDYAQQFGWSAPQWFSLPKLVAEAAAAAEAQPSTARRPTGDVGWVAPATIDIDAVARLRSQTLQMPLPWVFDWSALQTVEAEAATHLSQLFRQWANEQLDMRWLAGDRFLQVLQEAAPTGVRDADPAFWIARLDALRLANRPDHFDETAIDYCVTYEVSPPSWERTRAQVRISGAGHTTHTPPLSQVSDVSTTFLESSLADEAAGGVKVVAGVELAGQLVGDIGATLRRLDEQLGTSPLVTVTCTKLIRVDFIAAGDLLNWVLAKRGENRSVTFAEAHRLVALFFGAMGINEHARVRLHTV